MYGVKIYQETADSRIHDTDNYYFNTETEAEALEGVRTRVIPVSLVRR